MKNVYRPVRAEYSDGKLTFTNTNRFKFIIHNRSLGGGQDGNILSPQTRLTLDIEPEQSKTFDIDFKIPRRLLRLPHQRLLLCG